MLTPSWKRPDPTGVPVLSILLTRQFEDVCRLLNISTRSRNADLALVGQPRLRARWNLVACSSDESR